MMLQTPKIPVSWGELIDKITILEIKSARLSTPEALANVAKELALLRQAGEPEFAQNAEVLALKERLRVVNETLWDIEDRIREKEALGAFDDGFVALARSVYQRNDERAALKRQINSLLSSELVEEKGYAAY
jgi:hypothetical protein